MAGAGLIALALASAAFAAPPSRAAVSIHRDAAVYHLLGEFRVKAPPAQAWSVLTDYEGIARFVSTMRESRVLSRKPDEIVVEQEGLGSFLFFSKSVKLKLAVRESPPDRIYFEQVGDSPFDLYEGHWTVSVDSADCVVGYDLAIEPKNWMGPSFVARKALVTNVERQLDAVKTEIERRARRVEVAGGGP